MELSSMYSNANSQGSRDTKDLLREFVPQMNWNDDETILDIGCGPGDITRDILLPHMACKSCRVVGVDVSHSMVQHAACNFPHSCVEYHVLDIGNKENPREKFPDGFSKIFSFYCLHWINDYSTWLENIHSLLRPAGEMLVMFPRNIYSLRPLQLLSRRPEWAPYMKDVSNFVSQYYSAKDPAQQLARAAKATGFEVLFCEEVEKTYEFESVDVLRHIITSVNPFYLRMPEEEGEKYIDACMEWICSDNKRTQGSETTVQYTLLVVRLRKPN